MKDRDPIPPLTLIEMAVAACCLILSGLVATLFILSLR
jgi:hypothetical protein